MPHIRPINLDRPGAATNEGGRLQDPLSSLNKLRNAGLTDAEIVETLAHVGLNLFTNYFNHVANTEIDFPFVTAATNNSDAYFYQPKEIHK